MVTFAWHRFLSIIFSRCVCPSPLLNETRSCPSWFSWTFGFFQPCRRFFFVICCPHRFHTLTYSERIDIPLFNASLGLFSNNKQHAILIFSFWDPLFFGTDLSLDEPTTDTTTTDNDPKGGIGRHRRTCDLSSVVLVHTYRRGCWRQRTGATGTNKSG